MKVKNSIRINRRGNIAIVKHPDFDDRGWVKIPDFTDYYIHKDGFVKSVKIVTNPQKRTKTKKECILSMFTVQGYLAVNLVEATPNKRKSVRIHILVAGAFIGERPDGCDVMHLDGNKINACIENLRYGSRSCNEAFKIEHGTALIGERHHQAKLKEKDIFDIRNKLKAGIQGATIARQYRVTPSCICCIKKGRSWASI